MVFRESDSGGEGRGCALVANATLRSFSNIFQCIVGWLHECENLGYGQWLIEILDVKDRNKRGRERRRASRSKLVWFFCLCFFKRTIATCFHFKEESPSLCGVEPACPLCWLIYQSCSLFLYHFLG